MADGTNPQTAPQKTVSQVLGEITWLLTQSPTHKQLFIGDLEWFAMPAILLEQFRIWNGPNSPAAVAFWAFVSEETEQRLLSGGQKLRADEWKAGDRPWLIELVSPFGGQDEILADLALNVFTGQTFRFHTVDASGQRVVASYPPEPQA
ncbi:hypothetical protein AS593_18630 [Caulobacter vibrioides]|nr:hypothetical protein AS593_18630 [Caulobacter vibrioides]